MKQADTIQPPRVEEPPSSAPSASEEPLPASHGDDMPHNEDLPKWRLYLLTFSLGLANLLVALDTSILGKNSSPPPKRHT